MKLNFVDNITLERHLKFEHFPFIVLCKPNYYIRFSFQHTSSFQNFLVRKALRRILLDFRFLHVRNVCFSKYFIHVWHLTCFVFILNVRRYSIDSLMIVRSALNWILFMMFIDLHCIRSACASVEENMPTLSVSVRIYCQYKSFVSMFACMFMV